MRCAGRWRRAAETLYGRLAPMRAVPAGGGWCSTRGGGRDRGQDGAAEARRKRRTLAGTISMAQERGCCCRSQSVWMQYLSTKSALIVPGR